MQQHDPSRLLKVPEVAARLRISPRAVYALIQRGALRPVRIGPRATRVEAAEVERYVRDAGAGNAS